ncbi:MAG: hypothetical protein ACRC3H_21495 [Lachnospiraceae bacterium]
MQAQAYHVTSNIFGPYVLNTKVIPGLEKRDHEKEKKREAELFETIDDYIEQA